MNSQWHLKMKSQNQTISLIDDNTVNVNKRKFKYVSKYWISALRFCCLIKLLPIMFYFISKIYCTKTKKTTLDQTLIALKKILIRTHTCDLSLQLLLFITFCGLGFGENEWALTTPHGPVNQKSMSSPNMTHFSV